MTNSADIFQQEWSDITLRPFVSLAKSARPWFEVQCESGRDVIQEIPGLLQHLDDHLPVTYAGETGIAINLGTRALLDASFLENFLAQIRARQITPSRLRLMINDRRIPDSGEVISELANCGLQLMADRFIADHRLFDVLANPHVNVIRLDVHMARDILRSALARRLVKGLKALADELNKQLIAAGIESFSQALAFESLGCDTFQGPYYGDGMTVDQALVFAREARQIVTPVAFRPTSDYRSAVNAFNRSASAIGRAK